LLVAHRDCGYGASVSIKEMDVTNGIAKTENGVFPDSKKSAPGNCPVKGKLNR